MGPIPIVCTAGYMPVHVHITTDRRGTVLYVGAGKGNCPPNLSIAP